MELKLGKINNDSLILGLKALITKEREVLTQILHYLKEIESRRLYLARGFSSLFAFMTEELGYSEAAAQRRIAAMRLVKEIPEVEPKIKRGEISLSVASQVQTFLRKEKISRKEQKQAPIKPKEKLELIQSLAGTSARDCEKKLIKMNPQLNTPKEKTRPITEDKTLIQFTANKKLMDKIHRLKALLSHKNPENSYELLFEQLTDLALEKLDPIKRQQRRSKRENAQAPRPGALKSPVGEGERTPNPLPTSEVKRYIPQRVKDYIWTRDKGSCQYQDKKTGRLCGSKQYLEIDHIFPYSLGGPHRPDNLQLKCRAHNQYRSRLLFGPPPLKT